tara:strand:+ start:333 stop:1844 length:1512 start_codon:yes stop_codon:yes gene_type:complete
MSNNNLPIDRWWSEIAKDKEGGGYGNKGDFGGADWIKWLEYARNKPGGTQQGYTDFMDWYGRGEGRKAMWKDNRESSGGLYDKIKNVKDEPSAYFGDWKANPNAGTQIQGDDRMTFYAAGGKPWDFYNYLNQNQGQLQGGDVRGAEGGLYDTTRSRAWDAYTGGGTIPQGTYRIPQALQARANQTGKMSDEDATYAYVAATGRGPKGYMRDWWSPGDYKGRPSWDRGTKRKGGIRLRLPNAEKYYNQGVEDVKRQLGTDYEWDHIGEGYDGVHITPYNPGENIGQGWKTLMGTGEGTWGEGQIPLDIHSNPLIPLIDQRAGRTQGSNWLKYKGRDPHGRIGSISYDWYNRDADPDKLDQWRFESGLDRDATISTKAQIDSWLDFNKNTGTWVPPTDYGQQGGSTYGNGTLPVDGEVVGGVKTGDDIDWNKLIEGISKTEPITVNVETPETKAAGMSLAGSSALYGTSATGVRPERSKKYKTGAAKKGTQQLSRKQLKIQGINI